MSDKEPLQFSWLMHQLADSLRAGGILFDNHLRILEMTAAAKETLLSEEFIDQALAKGTEKTIGSRWNDLIVSCLSSNQKAVFGKIPYWNGQRKQLLDMTCVPLWQGGRAVGGVMLLLNVTEKLDFQYETAHADRLMAIGQVAGKVAHELNNPLDGILRYLNLSLRMLEQAQPEKAVEYIQHCRSGLQRMAQIITEMLEFSRSRQFAVETSPLDKLLDDALRALDGSLKTINVRIVRNDQGPLPHFKTDALFQVFCNLIKNAADAMNGSGTLTITLGHNEDMWQIDFQDSGPGFGPYLPDDLFKPFFTTKAPGRGTGLGLSICKDILEKFGGHISAQNTAEGGACFSVCLPTVTKTTRS